MTTQAPDDIHRALAELRMKLGELEAAVAQRAPSREEPAPSSGGHRDMESAVDEMVAGALLRGRRTAGVLNGMFNLSPGLSGR